MFRSNHTRGQTNSQKGFLDHLDLGRGFSDFAKGAQTPPKFQPGRIPSNKHDRVMSSQSGKQNSEAAKKNP